MRAVELAVGIRLDIEDDPHPVVAMLVTKARDTAVEAVRDLVGLDFSRTDALLEARDLQLKVGNYIDLTQWLKDAVTAGREAETRLSPEDRDDLAEILGLTTEPEDV